MSIEQSLFPSSWKIVPISDVVFFQEGPGVRKFQYTDSGVKLLNGGNINKGILNLNTTERYISNDEAYGKYEHFLVEDGDLLIACSGVVVDKFDGKIAYARKEHLPLCMNTSTMRFRSLNRKVLHLDYFRWFLTTTYFKSQLRQLITGSAQLNFGPSHIKQMVLPLPPLETQKQIAAVLEKADQLRKDCQQMEQELNSLAQSVFIDMFGDPVTNPKGWRTESLDDLAKVQIGPFGSQLHKEDYITGGVPLINPTHIVKGQIVPDMNLTLTPEKFEELPNYHLKAGDIVMGRRGEMGRTALIDENSQGWFCGTGSLYIRITTQLIQPVFLNSVMSCSSMKSWLEEQSLGATMPNLNKKILHSIQVPIPTEELQRNYLVALDVLRQQRIEQKEHIKVLDSLFNSLMQKAFKGELNL